jgi:hypothetical protein
MKQDRSIRRESLPEEERRDDESWDYWRALIDFTLTLVRYWKLLIAGPLIAGAIAYAVASFLPKYYSSSAYLGPLDETTSRLTATVLFSPPVVQVLRQKFPQYFPPSSMTDQERDRYLKNLIKFKATVDAKLSDPKLLQYYVLEVQDTDPARAQEIATTMIETWLTTTKPPPDRLTTLERLMESNESQLADLSTAISQLLKHPELLTSDIKTGFAAVNLAEMIKLRTESVRRSEELKALIAGYSSDMFFSRPNLPDKPVEPVKREIVFRSMGITFVVLILFVLLRHMTPLVMASPVYGPKLKQIGDAMPWRRRAINARG